MRQKLLHACCAAFAAVKHLLLRITGLMMVRQNSRKTFKHTRQARRHRFNCAFPGTIMLVKTKQQRKTNTNFCFVHGKDSMDTSLQTKVSLFMYIYSSKGYFLYRSNFTTAGGEGTGVPETLLVKSDYENCLLKESSSQISIVQIYMWYGQIHQVLR
jgi:cellobiose-specific phosphotransferase system component IIA